MRTTGLVIGAETIDSSSDGFIDVENPATGKTIGRVVKCGTRHLDRAIKEGRKGLAIWQNTPARDRARILRNAGANLRSKSGALSPVLSAEVGKPLEQSVSEIALAADNIDWAAEEAVRSYGREVPSRSPLVRTLVVRQPVGLVAAFTPWNFPINQSARKLGSALAAGCAVILKAPEEAPESSAMLVRAFLDAGLPPGAIGLVFGIPAEISEYLLAQPGVDKIAFTGSTAVGKRLSALAGQYMKRSSMELGGHCPVVIFDDVNPEEIADLLVPAKFRNAGQICTSPTRFIVHDNIYDRFVERFVARASEIRLGDPLEPNTDMGPLAHKGRLASLLGLIEDAVAHGAKLAHGGRQYGTAGYFLEPTILLDVPVSARVLNEEPFGPLATINRFSTADEALAEANRIAYGLVSYVFTTDQATAHRFSTEVMAGGVSINHLGYGLPELPMGGVRDSGYGLEGGMETLEPYMYSKLITQKVIPVAKAV